MKDIGGYFELELAQGREYHDTAIRLNLGRTALEYILRTRKVSKIFVPYFTCDAVLEPILKIGTKFEFYHIDSKLDPVFNFDELSETDYFLYINYFGLKDKIIKSLARGINNLIIDNSQAFYSKHIPGVNTFYSPRKFFGVPDGGYLYTDIVSDQITDEDNSIKRFEHLLGRIEKTPEKYLLIYQENERSLSGQGIKRMSSITERILKSIDYVQKAKIRRQNFSFLREKLSKINEFEFNLDDAFVPMVFPFMVDIKGLREELIRNRVFIAKYWADVEKYSTSDCLEFKLANQIVALPIDQRYGTDDLKIILRVITNYLKHGK